MRSNPLSIENFEEEEIDVSPLLPFADCGQATIIALTIYQ